LRRYLITGGLGFIGLALAEELSRRGHVVGIIDDRPSRAAQAQLRTPSDSLELFAVSIGSPEAAEVIRLGWDGVFNLASAAGHAWSRAEPLADLQVNGIDQLNFTRSLADAKSTVSRVLFSSTRQVYGHSQGKPWTEQDLVAPPDINGCHKVLAENYHQLYGRVGGFDVVTLRLPNIYGPGMDLHGRGAGVVGTWLAAALDGKPVRIFGDGCDRRDFLFISDCVEAMVLAMESDTGRSALFNVSAAHPNSLHEAAQAIAAISGAALEFVSRPDVQEGIDIGDSVVSGRLFEQTFQWKASVDLTTGIEQTWKALIGAPDSESSGD
jgi:UDP-glucose 4-epimerase